MFKMYLKVVEEWKIQKKTTTKIQFVSKKSDLFRDLWVYTQQPNNALKNTPVKLREREQNITGWKFPFFFFEIGILWLNLSNKRLFSSSFEMILLSCFGCGEEIRLVKSASVHSALGTNVSVFLSYFLNEE